MSARMIVTSSDGGSRFQPIQTTVKKRVKIPPRTKLHRAMGFLNGMFR